MHYTAAVPETQAIQTTEYIGTPSVPGFLQFMCSDPEFCAFYWLHKNST